MALRIWAARLLIAVVVAWNLECALVFLLNPGGFAPGFELAGVPGVAAVRGFAVLFVMWNIPYLVALWHPQRQRVSLWEALVDADRRGDRGKSHPVFPPGWACASARFALRFITFDAAGVVACWGQCYFPKQSRLNKKQPCFPSQG